MRAAAALARLNGIKGIVERVPANPPSRFPKWGKRRLGLDIERMTTWLNATTNVHDINALSALAEGVVGPTGHGLLYIPVPGETDCPERFIVALPLFDYLELLARAKKMRWQEPPPDQGRPITRPVRL